MATVPYDEFPDASAEAPSPWVRAAKWALGILVALGLLLAGGLALIDSSAGHRYLVDRIAALALENGLRIRVGRIEGSIFGKAQLHDVRLYDDQGLFLSSPRLDLDWKPAAYLYNEIWIDTLDADLVKLDRIPKFRPTKKGPILPDIDIHIGRLDIKRFEIGAKVAGEPRAGRVFGNADIRAGRALVNLQAAVANGGDRLRLLLDAEPDRDKFDLDVGLQAPANSVAGALIGTRKPFQLQIVGDGSWKKWRGTALADLEGRRIANLLLTNEEGRYTAVGAVAAQNFATGRVAALLAPRLLVNASTTFVDRRLEGKIALRNDNLRGEAAGVVDLAQSSFEGVRVALSLTRPEVLAPRMRTEDLRVTALVDGAFNSARLVFRVTEPFVRFDNNGVRNLRVEGRTTLGSEPMLVPIRVTASSVSGVGEVAGGLLTNLSLDGVLRVGERTITSDRLRIRSDRLNGIAQFLYDLRTGQYQLSLSGDLNNYAVPGLGLLDIRTSFRVVQTPSGPRILGRGRATFRRLDNAFFRSLAGGLPVIDADLERVGNGGIYFRNVRLRAPKAMVNGNGFRRPDGTIHFEGSGRQAQYGPFRIVLDGNVARPRVELFLARPNDSAGLRDVRLNLLPVSEGYAYRAQGLSRLGPFTSNGVIVLPRSGDAYFRIANLSVAGHSARGVLRTAVGGFAGRLAIGGGGLDGELILSTVHGVQRVEAHLNANNARFPGPPPIVIGSGRIDGVALLDPGGMSVEGTVNLRGVQASGVTLSRLEATASLRGGTGQARFSLAGQRGQRFTFAGVANFTPRQIRVSGDGTVERRPIRLRNEAVLTREGGSWRLAPTTLSFEGGGATVSGLFGGGRTEIDARLRNVRLSVLEIFSPKLGLGGIASGTLRYASTGGSPSGRVDLRIRGLTRLGLVLTSAPIDVGLTGVLNGRAAALRAVAVSGGQTIGRAQARLAPLSGGGGIVAQLLRAPLFAQLRYTGASDTLWRLTGNDLIDLSGPVAIGADVGGTLRDPVIRGGVRSTALRLESPITGTVVSNLALNGRFGGSRLILDQFTGKTAGNGTVTGQGTFDLAAARGFGVDLRLQVTRARLLDRDDVSAAVTGPIVIRSDGAGGLISGDLALDRGRFTLGRASAARAVPKLNVREIGRIADEDDIVLAGQPPLPWQLDLKVRGDNRLAVNGLGLDSEWGADIAISGPVDAFRITGRADLVRGGYEFAGRRFDLERGVIRFVGNSPPDPIIDILAQSDAQGLNAQVSVRGTGLNPEIAFTSTPALPQDELLSRLLFGTSITNLSAPEALQLAAAVASLRGGGGGLDPVNAIRRAIGLDRLRILPADVSTGQRTAIAAGKYITRRVYAEVISDGQGYSATRIEYQITRWLTLLASISTIGRTGASVRISRDY